MIGTTNRCVWLLVLLGYLTLWVPLAGAQKTVWEQYQRAGVHAYKQGLYTEAEQQLTTALEEAERLGLPDQRLTVSLSILALVYSAQNQPEKAEPLYQRLLILRETTLGPDHLEVAACLDNLAEVYEAQGQYTRAEPFYQRALSIREKALRPTHPGIAASLHNLAGLYEAQGQYSQAEPLYQRGLNAPGANVKTQSPQYCHQSAQARRTLPGTASVYGRGSTAPARPQHPRTSLWPAASPISSPVSTTSPSFTLLRGSMPRQNPYISALPQWPSRSSGRTIRMWRLCSIIWLKRIAPRGNTAKPSRCTSGCSASGSTPSGQTTRT